MEKETSVDVRIARLELEHKNLSVQLGELKAIVVNLRDNHIHSLSKDLNEMKITVFARPTWLITSIIALLSSAVVGLLVALAKS